MNKQKAKEVFKVGKNDIGYVSDSFLEEFGNDSMGEGSVLKSQTLPRYMSDDEIKKELNIKECTLSDIFATLQSSTKEMKDGNFNIFYVKDHPSRVVSVCWGSDDGPWGVSDWRRDSRWFGGRRVFSPANDAGALSTESSGSLNLESAIKLVKENGFEIIKRY